jgi:ATP synthase protein I
MKEGDRGFYRQLAKVSIIGIEMVVSTFVGLAIGLYLDGLFETKPWLTILFLVVGIVAGFKNIFLEVKRIDN